MDLKDIRADIDGIDLQIRNLIMQRLDCSRKVAEAKQAAGSTDIYRADREQAMLNALGADVPADRCAPYLAVVRKITETSRMYQYNLIYDWNPELFATIAGSELAEQKRDGSGAREDATVKVRLSRPDHPNAMSTILAMIGDYGFDMKSMDLVGAGEKPSRVTFELTICGDIADNRMRRLLFQLSKESEDFRIIAVS